MDFAQKGVEVLRIGSKEFDLNLKNYMEPLVCKAVNRVVADSHYCDCQRCHDDTMALVLNQLPSIYYLRATDEAAAVSELERKYLDEAIALTQQAAETVHQAPRHDSDEPYHLMNYEITAVELGFGEVLPLTKACTCIDCLEDMAAYTLDQVSPKYVCTTKGAAYARLDELCAKRGAQRISLFFQAISYVDRHRRHSAPRAANHNDG